MAQLDGGLYLITSLGHNNKHFPKKIVLVRTVTYKGYFVENSIIITNKLNHIKQMSGTINKAFKPLVKSQNTYQI